MLFQCFSAPGDTIVTLFYRPMTIVYVGVTKNMNEFGNKIHRYRIDPMTVPNVSSGAAVVDSVNSGGSESTTAPPRFFSRPATQLPDIWKD